MRWVTVEVKEQALCGVIDGEEICVLGPEPLQHWLTDPQRAQAVAARTQNRIPMANARLRQPILRPGKMLAIALNYRRHVEETQQAAPTIQKWFIKQPTSANGPFDPVELPKVSDALDYEAELVVVIGKYGRHVPKDQALDIVGGLCCGCDYSVRDWQRASSTMIMGKGFDTHAPFGPWITSLDEIADIGALNIRCWVNGELRQSGYTREMIHDIQAQIAHLSAAFTLEPGDIIFTGTPAGVGAAFDPPRYLRTGDKVRIEIDPLGAIEQTIVPEPGGTLIGP